MKYLIIQTRYKKSRINFPNYSQLQKVRPKEVTRLDNHNLKKEYIKMSKLIVRNETNQKKIMWFDSKKENPIMQKQYLKSIQEKISVVDWNFAKVKTSHLTHNIHPYSAKFIPQIAQNLIKIFTVENEIVWDPFSGSGTTALECLLAKRNSINTDLNPLSKILGIAKTTKLDLQVKEDIELITKIVKNKINTKNSFNFITPNPKIPNIEKWFHHNAIVELSFLSSEIMNINTNNAKSIAQVALSKTVNQVSNQKEETKYTSTPRIILANYTLKLFLNNLEQIYGRIMQSSQKLGTHHASFFTIDLKKPLSYYRHVPIKKNSIDAVITSPPYPNVTDYHLYHRFRLFWLGFDPKILAQNEIGSHLRHQREKTGFGDYMKEMQLCMKNIFNGLKPRRFAAFVIGDGVYNKQVFRSTEELSKIGQSEGFKEITIKSRNIHETRRSFLKPARRAKTEKILILQKMGVK